MNERQRKACKDGWFTIRVVVGFVIQAFMILCTFALIEQKVEVMHLIPDQQDVISRIPDAILDAMVVLPTFAAGMAGMSWVKSQYIRFCLPEVMDDITKKILKS